MRAVQLLGLVDSKRVLYVRFAFIPFSGGAHMCIGLHFAYMQAKCFAFHFLQNLRVSMAPGYVPSWQMWPIPKPKDGLRVTLSAA